MIAAADIEQRYGPPPDALFPIPVRIVPMMTRIVMMRRIVDDDAHRVD